MKEKNVLVLISLVIAIAAIISSAYIYINRPRIAFVYNDKILHEYKAVKEGVQVYEQREKALRSNLDTLGMELNRMIKQYETERKTMSEKEKQLSGGLINSKQKEYYNYKEAIEQKIKEADDQLSAAVLKQIDTYVIDYAKEKGYDFILGTTGSGSLFFAADQYDITKEVLDGLNNTYDGSVSK